MDNQTENHQGKEATPRDEKMDGGLRSKADVFEQAIRDFGIEAALEYFNVKESDKQFFRNELSKPASTDSKEAIGDWKKEFAKAWGCKNIKELDKGTRLTIEWIEENVINKLFSGKVDSKEAIEDDRFEFAQWASHSDWVFIPSKNLWYNEEDEENITPKTSEELYKLFSPNEANK